MSRVPRAPFTKTESPGSLDALALLGTSRRKVRALRTALRDEAFAAAAKLVRGFGMSLIPRNLDFRGVEEPNVA